MLVYEAHEDVNVILEMMRCPGSITKPKHDERSLAQISFGLVLMATHTLTRSWACKVANVVPQLLRCLCPVMNPNDALIQKAMSSMVSHYCLYSFYSFRGVVAALASLHARRITTNFLHTTRGLYRYTRRYTQIVSSFMQMLILLIYSIQNIYVHSPNMETGPKQSSSYFPGPFLSSPVVLFRLHLLCRGVTFASCWLSHCHPPSLRIPLDTDILIAHGPAKNCADGNKGCPALLKARAACTNEGGDSWLDGTEVRGRSSFKG